jgi:hypothetical protein
MNLVKKNIYICQCIMTLNKNAITKQKRNGAQNVYKFYNLIIIFFNILALILIYENTIVNTNAIK